MNKPISTIVAATDFSEPARIALQRAALLAADTGATLELVHAAPLPIPMPVWGDMAGGTWIENSELLRASEQRIGQLRDELLATHPDLQIDLHVEAAPPVQLVLRRGDERAADLIVIGATGEGALARRLFGSTAQSIVRHVRRPLLVARLPVTGSYRKILAAIDFSEDSRLAAAAARRLAGAARLSLFTALEQPRFRIELFDGLDDETRHANLERARQQVGQRLRDLAAELGQPDAEIHVRDGRASHELDDVLAATGAELLAIGAHGKTRLEAGLLGSTSLHAIVEAPGDVLVLPHHG